MKSKTVYGTFTSMAAVVALAAIWPSAAAMAQGAGIEDKLKQTSEGTGRFRGGVYGSLGWGFGSKIEIPGTGGTRPSGLRVEGGVYGLFNPIRDFADIEAGLSISALTPSSSKSGSGATEYKTGFIAGNLYAGPVFRLGNSGSALAVGVHLLFGNKVLKDSGDTFVKAFPASMKSSPGAYLEYQYKGDGSKAIYFSRLSASKYDASFKGAPVAVNTQGKGNTLVTFDFGIKY